MKVEAYYIDRGKATSDEIYRIQSRDIPIHSENLTEYHTKVTELEVTDPEEAYESLQDDNSEYSEFFPLRSMMVGDVLVTPTRILMVGQVGFVELPKLIQ